MMRPSGARWPPSASSREGLGEPSLLGNLVHGVEPVGLGLVRPEEPEVVLIQPHDLPHQDAEEASVTDLDCSWFLDLDAESAEVRHVQGLADQPAVGDGVGAQI
jgi:hypothetical protein